MNWINYPIKLTIILIELNLCVRFTTSVVESCCKPDMKGKSLIIHFIYLWLHIYWNNQIGYKPDTWRTKTLIILFIYIFLATYLLKQPNVHINLANFFSFFFFFLVWLLAIETLKNIFNFLNIWFLMSSVTKDALPWDPPG